MHRPSRNLLFAFAAAAVMAFAVASCGPTAPVTCGPDTCSTGCCTRDGECLTGTEQGMNACGSGGKTCAACLPRQLCSKGACVADPDAGDPQLCDPTNCIGCCDGNECVPFTMQSAVRCGNSANVCAACPSGGACSDMGTCLAPVDGGGGCGKKDEPCCANGACFLGLTCQQGTCVTQGGGNDAGMGTDGGSDAGMTTDAGMGGTRAVGEACTSSAQCATGTCRVLNFAGGYCTKNCTAEADCPAGATCGADPNDSTGAQKICLAECASPGTTTGCRTDYVCEKRGTLSGGGACVPRCNSPATCGVASTCDPRGFCCGANGFACCNGTTCDTGLTCDSATGYCKPQGAGSAPIGDPCTANNTCASNICAFEAQGGSAGCATGPCWPGGYCIADCTSTACPSGSSCTPYLATNSICVENCPSPGTGVSTCRSGYVCDKFLIPGALSQGVCIDACNSKGDCNSATLDCHQGYCCGKVSFRCCSNNSCPYGGTCGPDGYCK